jgi:hypothetical protein
MRTLYKIFIICLILTITAALLINLFHVEFGHKDFWIKHDIFFLFFIAIFPRLTLFFSSVPFGGLFWWLGFFFAPRLLVAVLATVAYWYTNPILVIIAWLFVLGGESGEKTVVYRTIRVNRDSPRRMRNITPGDV